MILPVAPLLVPLGTSLLCTLTSNSVQLQRKISLLGSLLLLGTAIVLGVQVADHQSISLASGSWPLPFGIEVVVDRLGALLVFVAALMVLICTLWQMGDVDPAHSSFFYPLLHGLVAGSCAAFIAADLFNLYVWFEVALICSLGLLAQGGTLKHLDATLKYFALNLVGTLLLLTAVALLYGATGHLNFNALAMSVQYVNPAIMQAVTGLLILAFLVKAAAFPFFAWLPASYHTLPAPSLALFSALLSKIGICALIRTLSSIFHPSPEPLLSMLGIIAVLSMIVGVLGAAYHWDLRRILAFHSISQVGYMLLAMALSTRAGDAAAIFFALHHSLVKAGLFLCAAMIFKLSGHYDLRKVGGLYAEKPGLAAIFLLLALSLVGIPPFSGFWGKYLIVRECLVQGEYLWAFLALLVGALTFYSMMKIWLEAFWKPHPSAGWQAAKIVKPIPVTTGLCLLSVIILAIGLFPEPLIGFVNDAANHLRGHAP
ncbi:MAG: Na+/H+ antiporter subunit D [Deltaproteobacteria bacterium]|jgi:multicomponent Na+:H+ antiporter subunit D|nr:Na+/H+ antiporter subunit D [Deltaproteobacteria bacterium]